MAQIHMKAAKTIILPLYVLKWQVLSNLSLSFDTNVCKHFLPIKGCTVGHFLALWCVLDFAGAAVGTVLQAASRRPRHCQVFLLSSCSCTKLLRSEMSCISCIKMESLNKQSSSLAGLLEFEYNTNTYSPLKKLTENIRICSMKFLLNTNSTFCKVNTSFIWY